MALSIKRLSARHSAITDAAALISAHDTGTWDSDPEFHEILMQERKKIALYLEKKAERLLLGRETIEFECD